MGAIMRLKFSNTSKTMRGLSLIEILVALLIGSILILGALQLYLNVFRSDKTNTRAARMQEDGRVLTELLARYARRAGYQGCVSSKTETQIRGSNYPDDAIRGNASEIEFRYAKEDAKGSDFPNLSCDGRALKEFTIQFANKGDSIVMFNNEFGGQEQELVKNARFIQISYIEPCSAGSEQKCYRTGPSKNTTHIEITTEIFDPKNQIKAKTFHTSVALRNRNLPKL